MAFDDYIFLCLVGCSSILAASFLDEYFKDLIFFKGSRFVSIVAVLLLLIVCAAFGSIRYIVAD